MLMLVVTTISTLPRASKHRNAVRNAGIFGAIGQRGYRVLLRLDGGQGGRLIGKPLL